jgi:hypothetical protein
MGLGDATDLDLAETHVERVDDQVRLTHVFRYKPSGATLMTEPYANYQ